MVWIQRIVNTVLGTAGALLCVTCLCQADGSPRSLLHLTAVKGYYSYSVPWNLEDPEVRVPLNLPHTRSGMAIFIGHIKNTPPSGNTVVGGDLMIRMGRKEQTFRDIWKDHLSEAGTVKMPDGGPEEIYFASMEGDTFQSWHFNLFNPLTRTLVTLSYSWGHDDPAAVVKKSDNFDDPTLTHERELLETVTRDPYYGIPFIKK
jgi:hypothetical protein